MKRLPAIFDPKNTVNLAAPNRKTHKQTGFTLIELGLVIAIIGILSALALPFVREFLVEGRVDPTGKDIITVRNVMTANAAAQGGNTPYTGLGAPAAATATFANAASTRARSVVTAGAGAAATIQHQLGATGSQITVAQGTIVALGDSFDVTLPTVNKAACPGLSNQLARAAEVITINGIVVKAFGGQYNGVAAENNCVAGDNNAYVFTFR